MFSEKQPFEQNIQPEHDEISCMPNISSIISSHNKSVLTKEAERNPVTNTQDWNCRKKETCLLSGKCLTEGVVYKATVTREDNAEVKGIFKTRYHNHTSSFRNQKHINSTALSKYISGR